ncbi:hypothetical protein QAZ01_10265 [Glaesserella parasuis]|uniref:hypothetical protein n=1 Tax=Glaesserella parasuis TaxID=738 RepID=UPI002436964F|nr:hypothetical protein [Glaesserella parasuis]MDG6451314.1 hypothetical protein [Glaesserella parasuis]MDO9792323.1 hypothetical protein [Glaesserella parasuis]
MWPFNRKNEEEQIVLDVEKAEDSYPNFPKDKKGGEYQRQLQKIEQANKNILAGGDAQDGDEESRIKMSLRVLWGTDYFCIERKKKIWAEKMRWGFV